MSLLILAQPAQAQETKDPERLIQLLEAAVEGIHSYEVVAQASVRTLFRADTVGEGKHEKLIPRRLRPDETPHVRREFYRQVYQQGKGRVEFLDGPGGKVIQVVGYDGEASNRHDVQAKQALIRPAPVTFGVPGADYREAFRSALYGLSLVTCLRQRHGHLKVLSQTDGSPPLVTVEAGPVLDDSREVFWAQWGLRVSLDPRRGMMPAVVETLQPINGKLHLYKRMTVNDWKDVGGVWVPIKATTHVFFLDPTIKELHNQIANEAVMVVDVARSSWNVKVSAADLRVPLPAGTKVQDMRRSVSYVTGKADPGNDLKGLVASARDIVPIKMGPGPETAAVPSWIKYAAAALVLVVVLGVGCLILRRRRLGNAT